MMDLLINPANVKSPFMRIFERDWKKYSKTITIISTAVAVAVAVVVAATIVVLSIENYS